MQRKQRGIPINRRYQAARACAYLSPCLISPKRLTEPAPAGSHERGFCPRGRVPNPKRAQALRLSQVPHLCEARSSGLLWTSGFAQEREPPSLRGGKLGKGVGKQTTPYPKQKRSLLSASFCIGLRLCPTIFLKLQGCPPLYLSSDYCRCPNPCHQLQVPHLRGARSSGLP